MNATLNLAIVLAGPLVVTTVVAAALWLVHRDTAQLGGRLRRWDFWAALAPYAFFALVMSLSMAIEGESYPIASAIASVVVFAALPLGVWLWLRFGGRGLPAVMYAAVAGLCALAIAVSVDPQRWWDIQNGGYPLASVVALAIGAAAAVWGRRAPVPGGGALLVAGVVPLGTCLVASAAADEVLLQMFAPMPMFALLGVAYLVAARLERGREHRAPGQVAPDRSPDRTMAA
jgi:uncharacterized membrane protein YhaH (DUF805 family)